MTSPPPPMLRSLQLIVLSLAGSCLMFLVPLASVLGTEGEPKMPIMAGLVGLSLAMGSMALLFGRGGRPADPQATPEQASRAFLQNLSSRTVVAAVLAEAPAILALALGMVLGRDGGLFTVAPAMIVSAAAVAYAAWPSSGRVEAVEAKTRSRGYRGRLDAVTSLQPNG